MNKSIVLKISTLIMSILLMVGISVNTVYCSFFSYYPAKEDNGKVITITGDSYAGFFASYECFKEYGFLIYANAGKSTKENYEIMKTAINFFPDTIIISIGVNDHSKNVTLDDFKNGIEELVSISRLNRKKIILHTYMDYDDSIVEGVEHLFTTKDYDNILRDISKKNSNVFYVDMSDYNEEVYLQNDKIHYNKLFYDELYRRVSTALMLF